MQCPECHTENPEQAKFCFNCAYKFSSQQSITAEQKFAKYIPEQLLSKIQASSKIGGLQGERRIITVLFCDIIGSTSTAETMDPEDWAEIMNEIFDHIIPPVYEYEGIIARLMGDAILAFFGAPISHEDDPERAVLAAMKMIEELQQCSIAMQRTRGIPLSIRVGINTGLVVVGEIGSDMRVEYTAMGDVINVASRMESTATPGKIRVTEHTFKYISYLFNGTKIGAVDIKGKSKPIVAYEIDQKRSEITSRHSAFDLNFVGREAELNQLQHIFSQILHSIPQLVTITGDAGIGKSRLVREFQNLQKISSDSLDTDEISWLDTAAFSYQQTIPLVPFIDLLYRQIGIKVEMNDETKWTLLTNHLHEIGMNQHHHLVYFGILLGLNAINDVAFQIGALDPPVLRGKIFETFKYYLHSLLGPIILVIDDVQWLDESSHDLLLQLLQDPPNEKLLIILLYRTTAESSPLFTVDQVKITSSTINITAFDQQQAEILVAHLLKNDNLPLTVLEMINDKAEGNPFFVSELVRGLIDDGQIVNQQQTWIMNPDIATIKLPDTLTNLLMTRLDKLSEGSRYVAQSAAVIGRQFYYKVLDCLVPSLDLPSHLTDLETKEWIISDMTLAEKAYFFKHLITKEVAYNSLLKKTRRDLHHKIAECICSINSGEIEEIAHHFLEARDYENAVPYVLQSAQKARIANANNDSLVLLKKIEPVVETLDFEKIHDTYVGLGETYAMLGQLDNSQQQYQLLLSKSETVHNERGIVSALNKMARNLVYQKNNIVEADEFLTRAEEISSRLNFKEGLIETSAIRCAMYQGMGDLDSAADYEKKGVALLHDMGDSKNILDFKHNLTISLMLSHRLDEAEIQVKEIVEIARQTDNKFRLSTAYGFLLPYIRIARGNLSDAKAAAKLGFDIGQEINTPFALFLTLSNLGDLELLQGNFQQAYEYLIEGGDTSQLVSYFGLPAMVQTSIIIASQKLGQHSSEELEKMVMKTNALMNVPYGDYWGAGIWSDLGYYYLTQNNYDEAGKYLYMALEHISAPQLFYHGRVVCLLIISHILQGNLEQATSLLDLNYNDLFAGTYLQYQPDAYFVAGVLHYKSGKFDQAKQHLLRAEELAKNADRLPLLWQVNHYKSKISESSDPGNQAALIEKNRIHNILLNRFTNIHLQQNFKNWLDGNILNFEDYELLAF